MTVVRYALVFTAALALAILLSILVGPLGLVVPAGWILPVTYGVAAAFSALGAAWVGNVLVRNGSRARLAWVLLGTEATALLMLGLLVGAETLLGIFADFTFFEEILATMIPVSLNATILSLRSREPRTRWAPDLWLSLTVAMAALLAPVLLLLVGCPFIGCSG